MNDVIATVNKVELVNQNVYEIKLHVGIDRFKAGQHLLIQLPTGETVPYSIGSAPSELPEVTLYILVAEVDSLAGKVVQYLQNNNEVSLKMAAGDCHVDNGAITDSVEHILLLAGGTGFAQMKSMYDALTEKGLHEKITLYWGVRTPQDIFLNEWVSESDNIEIIVNEADESWQGATGWLYEKVIADQKLKNAVVYVSGSPAMVYGTLDKLEEAGLPRQSSYSDVFAYAPRPE